LKEYLFSGTINPNNNDTLVQLAEFMLINLDKLENLNRSEIGSLNEIITKTKTRMRKAYGNNNVTMPRSASFSGIGNTAQFGHWSRVTMSNFVFCESGEKAIIKKHYPKIPSQY
jgi:predicted P-loop ATPase